MVAGSVAKFVFDRSAIPNELSATGGMAWTAPWELANWTWPDVYVLVGGLVTCRLAYDCGVHVALDVPTALLACTRTGPAAQVVPLMGLKSWICPVPWSEFTHRQLERYGSALTV